MQELLNNAGFQKFLIYFIVLLVIIGIIAVMLSDSSASEEEDRMLEEQKIRNLKIEYEKDPTFVNQYAWYKKADSYRFWYTDDERINLTDKLLIEYVQNYTGKNQGTDTILDVIRLSILLADVDIDHPSTSIGWYVLGTTIIRDRIIDNSKTVVFSFETYNDESKIKFFVDVKTGDVTYGNDVARDILNVIE